MALGHTRGAASARGAAPLLYAVAGHAVVWSLVAISAIYAVRFGMTLVPWAPWLGAVLSGAFEVMKALLLTLVIAAWSSRQRIRALAGLGLLGVLVVYSAAAVQFMATADIGGRLAEAEKVGNERRTLAGALAAAEKARDESTERAAVGEIRAAIDGLLARPGVNGCATVDGRVTREVCPQVAVLKGRLAAAEARDRVLAEIGVLQFRLSQLPPAAAGSEGAARWVVTLVAAALEALTLLGLWVVGPVVRSDIGARLPAAGSPAVSLAPVPDAKAAALLGWLVKQKSENGVVEFRQRAAGADLGIPPAAVGRALKSLVARSALEVVDTGRAGTRVRLAN